MDLEDWLPVLYRTWKTLTGRGGAPQKAPIALKGPAAYRNAKHAKAPPPELQNPGLGRAHPSQAELTIIANGVRRLSRGFTGHRNLVGSRYLEDPELLGAYLLYYWPISYLQARHVAADLVVRNIPLSTSILDCGSGPGPMAFALLDAALAQSALSHQGTVPSKTAAAVAEVPRLCLLDHSTRALEIATALATAAYPEDQTPAVQTMVWNPEKTRLAALVTGTWPLISFGHSLNEFWQGRKEAQTRRLELLNFALALGGSDAMVLAVEPALRESTTQLLELRDNLVAAGHPIYGPCNYAQACPALAAGQTCHGLCTAPLPRTVQTLASMAGLDKEQVAMAWLAFGPKAAPWPVDKNWWRITSETMLNKAGRTRYMVCGTAGRQSLSAKLPTTSKGVSMPKAYQNFAHLARGSAIRLAGTQEREGGLGLEADSTIDILSPLL